MSRRDSARPRRRYLTHSPPRQRRRRRRRTRSRVAQRYLHPSLASTLRYFVYDTNFKTESELDSRFRVAGAPDNVFRFRSQLRKMRTIGCERIFPRFCSALRVSLTEIMPCLFSVPDKSLSLDHSPFVRARVRVVSEIDLFVFFAI